MENIFLQFSTDIEELGVNFHVSDMLFVLSVFFVICNE